MEGTHCIWSTFNECEVLFHPCELPAEVGGHLAFTYDFDCYSHRSSRFLAPRLQEKHTERIRKSMCLSVCITVSWETSVGFWCCQIDTSEGYTHFIPLCHLFLMLNMRLLECCPRMLATVGETPCLTSATGNSIKIEQAKGFCFIRAEFFWSKGNV